MERESDIDAVVDHDDVQISKKQRMATVASSIKVLNPPARNSGEIERIREDLDKQGFSVVQDILTTEEQGKFYDYFMNVRRSLLFHFF
jgi:hypothetical protein